MTVNGIESGFDPSVELKKKEWYGKYLEAKQIAEEIFDELDRIYGEDSSPTIVEEKWGEIRKEFVKIAVREGVDEDSLNYNYGVWRAFTFSSPHECGNGDLSGDLILSFFKEKLKRLKQQKIEGSEEIK